MLRNKLSIIIASVLPILFLASCGNGSDTNASPGDGDTITSRAEILTLVRYDSTYTVATIADPWNPGKTLAQYVLLNRNAKRPNNLPEGTIIQVPVSRSVVYSIVHQEAINELGASNAISCVADESYITNPDLLSRIEDGSVKTIGSSRAPNVDVMVKSNVDAILVSSYGDIAHNELDTLGIPVIECADYMESSPLARAEWVLLLGELYGCPDQARDMYNRVVDEYTSLTDSVQHNVLGTNKVLPRIITEMVSSGIWYIPGGKSYMARMFADAGADYPFADTEESGSICLDVPTVLNKAQTADVWLVRSKGAYITEESLREVCPLNARFKAFIDGNVYCCNTSVTNLYNDIAFHPERILRDYIIILHPELLPDQSTYYFKKIEKGTKTT